MSSFARRRPVVFSLAIVLGVSLAASVAVTFSWSRSWTVWAVCWLLTLNAATFVTYGYDKRQATKGGWRIPERTLHLLALLGGSVGAFAAMYVFRHKTIKGGFRLVFWLIAAIQLLCLIWLAWEVWRK